MSKKGGYYCAFKNCKSLSRRDKRSFFRFPKDPQRSKQWVEACGRRDLVDKTPIELFNSYRVCAIHFTDSMFLNDLRNRLQPNSVPIQSGILGDGQDDTAELQKVKENHEKIAQMISDSLQNETLAEQRCAIAEAELQEINEINQAVSVITNNEMYTNMHSEYDISNNLNANETTEFPPNSFAIEIDNEDSNGFTIEAINCLDIINSLPITLFPSPSADSNESSIISQEKTVDLNELPVTILEDYPATTCIATTSMSNNNAVALNFSEIPTQTDFSYLKDRLSKQKLKKILYNKRCIIRNLRKKAKQNLYDILDNITIEEYELLTDKFFPKDTSDFVKLQAQLFKKKEKCREYSPEFKKHCLSLFLAGPKLYKYFQKLFCLPGVRDLHSLRDSVHK